MTIEERLTDKYCKYFYEALARVHEEQGKTDFYCAYRAAISIARAMLVNSVETVEKKGDRWSQFRPYFEADVRSLLVVIMSANPLIAHGAQEEAGEIIKVVIGDEPIKSRQEA